MLLPISDHYFFSSNLAPHRLATFSAYWPSRSSKVDDFHLIWKGVCYFLLVTPSNLSTISHRFQDTATYSLKLSTENCGQTTADRDTVTIDSL